MNKKGTLYTSYFKNLNTKRFLDFTGIIYVVSRIIPHDIPMLNKIEYEHKLELAPSKELLTEYKSCRISFIQFRERFIKEINENGSLKTILDILDGGDNVLILCYERNEKLCHRGIIREMISKFGYNTKIL